jgi:hypothetical protein
VSRAVEQESLFAQATGEALRPRRLHHDPWGTFARSLLTHYLAQRRAGLATVRIYRCYHWVTDFGWPDPAQLAALCSDDPALLPLRIATILSTRAQNTDSRTGRVVDRVARRGARPSIIVQECASPFARCCATLLATIAADPVLFSLTLLAPGSPTYADLARIARQAHGAELLLAVDGARLARLARQRVATGAETPAPAAAERPYVHPLTALMRSDAWKALWQGNEMPIVPTLHLLAAQLKRLYPLVFIASLPAPGQPEPWKSANHYLIYATRAPEAACMMNDLLVAEEIRCREAVWTTILQGAWFRSRAAAARAQMLDEARSTLLALLGQRRAPFWPDLRLLLITRTFGRLATADYDILLRDLLAAGMVRCHRASRRGALSEDALPGPRDRLELTPVE